MERKTKLKELSTQEMTQIDGGHEGFFYHMGRLAAKQAKFVLGIFAGIREGLVSELDK